MILHLIENEDWQKVKETEVYSPSSIKTEGFIHCSTFDQVEVIANLFFKESTSLKVLCIDTEKVHSKIVYEDTENFGQLFPHLYGPLNLDSVTKVIELLRDQNGRFIMPNELKEMKNRTL